MTTNEHEEEVVATPDLSSDFELPFWAHRVIGALTVVGLFWWWPFDGGRPGMAESVGYFVIAALVVETQVQISNGRIPRTIRRLRRARNAGDEES